jgi:hypothetical protein
MPQLSLLLWPLWPFDAVAANPIEPILGLGPAPRYGQSARDRLLFNAKHNALN